MSKRSTTRKKQRNSIYQILMDTACAAQQCAIICAAILVERRPILAWEPFL